MKKSLLFLLLLAFFACHNAEKPAPNPYANAKIEVKTFRVDSTGFGYDIYLFGGRYVHQPEIPAINGLRCFKSEEDAQKTGTLVAYKIRNNIMPPALSIAELDSLGVLK